MKLDGQFFVLGHLPEIWKIRTDNRHSVSASKVSNAATSCRRGIRHNRDAATLKQVPQIFFRDVAEEFDSGVAGALLFDRLCVALRLRMISAGNDEFRPERLLGEEAERFDH